MPNDCPSRNVKLRPSNNVATLMHLAVPPNDLEPVLLGEGAHGRLLRLEPSAGLLLLVGRDAGVGNELAASVAFAFLVCMSVSTSRVYVQSRVNAVKLNWSFCEQRINSSRSLFLRDPHPIPNKAATQYTVGIQSYTCVMSCHAVVINREEPINTGDRALCSPFDQAKI
jgi:hypothetical protein